MEKIGFFGGCFNPPTNIHIKIANNLIKTKKLDKVIFVPVNDSYIKSGLISAEHRLNMIKLAIKDNNKLEVDDIETKENKKLFAVDAFELINQKYSKKCEVYFIMGSDNFEKMSKWKDYNKIKDQKYIVIKRDKNEISSTKIREMIANNNSEVQEYLSKEVYKYIEQNKLYKM